MLFVGEENLKSTLKRFNLERRYKNSSQSHCPLFHTTELLGNTNHGDLCSYSISCINHSIL